MANLAEVAGWCYQAGWRGSDLNVAVALAFAESGGNPNARRSASKNPDGGNDLGLFQINDKWHPEVKGITWNSGPANAKLAYTIQRARGWGEWSAHNNRSYLLYMPAATAAAVAYVGSHPKEAAESVADAVVPDAASALLRIAEEPVRIARWATDPGTVTRFAKGAIGVALVVGALVVFVKPVVSAAPIGKIAKVLK